MFHRELTEEHVTVICGEKKEHCSRIHVKHMYTRVHVHVLTCARLNKQVCNNIT